MSEATSEPKAKLARPLNRWGQGTLSVLQIVFLAIALIALNYLAAHHFMRSDLSREAAYTLSPATQRYLKEEVTKRDKPIKWIMSYRRSSEFYERVRVLAEEYARLSDGKIVLEIVDPLRSSDRTQEVMATYGFPLTKDLLIIDARTDESAVSTEEITDTPTLDANSTEKKSVRILNPHVKVVIAEDMTVFATDNKKQRKSVGFQGEDVMTARLVEALEGRARKMYFLSDKSRIEAEGEKSPLKFLQELLLLQNVELRGISIANLDEIPADAEGLTLIAPKYDLTDKELAVLDSYWNRPRGAVLMLLKPGDTPPKLRTFLRGYGVTPRRDRVISMQGKSINSVARGVFTYGVDFTKDLAIQGVIFEGATSSLEVREGADDLMSRQINPVGLIQAAEGFWGETKFGEKNTTFDENEDTKAASLFYAASITRGAANNDKFAAETSRMVVIANTDFLDPDRQHEENVDFLASSVNWLMDRQSLFGIGPRSLGTYKLPLLEAQVSFINRVNLFFLPALLAVIGAFIWSSRRA